MNESGIIRIGHYLLGKTIGSGGFAKVKGKASDYLRYNCGNGQKLIMI